MVLLSELLVKAEQNKQSHKQLVQKLKKNPPPQLDTLCQKLHTEIFEKMDCLSCGNCCRSLGPRLTDRDIDKLSKSQRTKPSVFTQQYLRVDEDGDFVFKCMPCPFLGNDNYCSVYDDRPKACREYPHTDGRKMIQLLPLALKNSSTCPAVFELLEQLKKIYV